MEPAEGSILPDLPLVVFLGEPSADFLAAFSAKFHLIPPASSLSASASAMLDCQGLSRVDSVILDQYPSARCLISVNAGVNHIDLAECRKRGVQVANAGHVYSRDVADYAVGLLIDVLRKVTLSDRYLREELRWVQRNCPLGSRVCSKNSRFVPANNNWITGTSWTWHKISN